jgi:uncharacterized membrane protein
MLESFESTIAALANYLQAGFEAASVLVVAAGGVAFAAALFRRRNGVAAEARYVLARFLVVALELQLAADIISTATDPTLEELGKLAVIALIRTFLNYFLVAEMRAEQKAN